MRDPSNPHALSMHYIFICICICICVCIYICIVLYLYCICVLLFEPPALPPSLPPLYLPHCTSLNFVAELTTPLINLCRFLFYLLLIFCYENVSVFSFVFVLYLYSPILPIWIPEDLLWNSLRQSRWC